MLALGVIDTTFAGTQGLVAHAGAGERVDQRVNLFWRK